MKFTRDSSEVYVPDGLAVDQALARTTHLGIGAHQDDLEIMCLDGILAGFANPDEWFCGVVVTDGRGSPRMGPYADYTDEQMMQIRRLEQKKSGLCRRIWSAGFHGSSKLCGQRPVEFDGDR